MHTEEWHRFGLVMDMCDLRCPWSAGWFEGTYRRFVVGDDGIFNVGGIDGADDDGGEGDDSSTIARIPPPRAGRRGHLEE